MSALPRPGRQGGWASGWAELGSERRPLCPGLRLPPCGWGRPHAKGQTCPCSPAAQSAQLGQQDSRLPGNGWEASPGCGLTSPKARLWRGTQAGGGSHHSAPALTPKCSRPRQRLSRRGWGRRQLPRARPHMRPGQLCRQPPLTFVLHGQLPGPRSPAWPCLGDERQGLTTAGPA